MKALLLGCRNTLGELIICEPALHALRIKHPDVEIDADLDLDLGGLALTSGLVNKVVTRKPFVADMTYFVSGHPLLTVVGSIFLMPAGLAADKTTPIALARARKVDETLTEAVPVLSVPKVTGAEGYVALHATGSPGKMWPQVQWEQLAQLIAATGKKLLLIGGRADMDCGPRIAAKLKKDCYATCFYQPLTQVAGWLQNCSCLIGGETGISHLAAALGIKVLATWNPEYAHYAPPGPNFHSIALTATRDEVFEKWKVLNG